MHGKTNLPQFLAPPEKANITMKTHPLAQVIIDKNLELKESLKAVWTGGLTGWVSYTLLDNNGAEIATAYFSFNRHLGTYRKQGTAARAGTARSAALDRLLADARAA